MVQEYLRTAKPVASRDLVRARQLAVSPATIRNEMGELDKSGYLEQPYTSAGRIPTERGYRFFVDYLLRESVPNRKQAMVLDRVFEEEEDEEAFVKELTRMASRMSHTYSAGGLWDDMIFFQAGLAEVFLEPEFADRGFMVDFGKFADTLEEEIRALFREDTLGESRVFIGKENPLSRSCSYGMIVAPWRHRRGFGGFLAMIGPTRMDYQRNLAVMRYITQL